MGKKKKKKKKDAILTINTANLDTSYRETMLDIQMSQSEVQKLIKKEMKAYKKTYGYPCSYETARRKVMRTIEGRNPIDRIVSNISSATPQLVVLSQLAGIGIETVLSIPAVQRRITPSSMEAVSKLYNSCVATGVKKKKKK